MKRELIQFSSLFHVLFLYLALELCFSIFWWLSQLPKTLNVLQLPMLGVESLNPAYDPTLQL